MNPPNAYYELITHLTGDGGPITDRQTHNLANATRRAGVIRSYGLEHQEADGVVVFYPPHRISYVVIKPAHLGADHLATAPRLNQPAAVRGHGRGQAPVAASAVP